MQTKIILAIKVQLAVAIRSLCMPVQGSGTIHSNTTLASRQPSPGHQDCDTD